MMDPLLPFRVCAWWAGLFMGTAHQASRAAKPANPTRRDIQAELAAMPEADRIVLPPATTRQDREAKRLSRAIRDAMSPNEDIRAKGEAALRKFATTAPAAARRAARKSSK